MDYGSDIVKGLKEMKNFSLATPQPRKFPEIPELEQIYLEAMMKKLIDKEDKLETEKKKAFHVLHGQCTRELIGSLEAKKSYQKIEESRDPFELIKMIKDVINKHEDYKYAFQTSVEILIKLFRMIQREGDTPLDYEERMRGYIDLIKVYGIQLGIDQRLIDLKYKKPVLSSTMTAAEKKELEEIAQAQAKQDAIEQFYAVVYLMNARRDAYGAFIRDLEDNFEAGTNKWPTTMALARQRLEHHKPNKPSNPIKPKLTDAAHYTTVGNDNNNSNKNKGGGKNHQNDNDNQANQGTPNGSKQGSLICFGCGDDGHTIHQCNKRDKWNPSIRNKYEEKERQRAGSENRDDQETEAVMQVMAGLPDEYEHVFGAAFM